MPGSDLEFYRLLIEQWDSLIAVVSGPDHVFALANAGYRALFGEDLVGKPVRQALPDANPRLFNALDKVFATGGPVAITGVPVSCLGENKRSSFIDFTYNPVRQGSEITGVSIHGVDVTSHVVMQDELRADAAIALGTLDAMPLAICLFDKFLILRLVNAAALKISGRAACEVTDKHYQDIVGPERFEKRRPLLANVLAGQEIAFVEESIRPSGDRLAFNYRFIPRWVNGEVVGFYLVTRDVTPQPATLLN